VDVASLGHIKKIDYQSGYADSLAKELLAEAGIEIMQIIPIIGEKFHEMPILWRN
jgi:hypothetical protein